MRLLSRGENAPGKMAENDTLPRTSFPLGDPRPDTKDFREFTVPRRYKGTPASNFIYHRTPCTAITGNSDYTRADEKSRNFLRTGTAVILRGLEQFREILAGKRCGRPLRGRGGRGEREERRKPFL